MRPGGPVAEPPVSRAGVRPTGAGGCSGPAGRGRYRAAVRVVALWRYPVKSLQGEPVDAIDVGSDGFAHDRAYGIVNLDTGLVLTARRDPRLLHAAAACTEEGVRVTLPGGSVARDDTDLCDWLGLRVELRAADPAVAGRYETVFDVEHEETAEWFEWEGPPGPFHDSTRTRVSILSEGSLGEWDARRFRANVVVSGSDEQDLAGSTVQLGTTVLAVTKPIDRCVMVTRGQPGGIERDLDVLRTINRDRASFLGVGALVRRPGRIGVDDEVEVVERGPTPTM